MGQAPSSGRRGRRRFAGAALIMAGASLLVGGMVLEYLNIATTDSEGYSISEPYKI